MSLKGKARYIRIAMAIYKLAKENDEHAGDRIREWIMLFEDTRVVGWSRDDFLMACVDAKKFIQRKGKDES